MSPSRLQAKSSLSAIPRLEHGPVRASVLAVFANDAQHAAYTCMAWDALTQAAKLDPEAAANARAMTSSRVH